MCPEMYNYLTLHSNRARSTECREFECIRGAEIGALSMGLLCALLCMCWLVRARCCVRDASREFQPVVGADEEAPLGVNGRSSALELTRLSSGAASDDGCGGEASTSTSSRVPASSSLPTLPSSVHPPSCDSLTLLEKPSLDPTAFEATWQSCESGTRLWGASLRRPLAEGELESALFRQHIFCIASGSVNGMKKVFMPKLPQKPTLKNP